MNWSEKPLFWGWMLFSNYYHFYMFPTLMTVCAYTGRRAASHIVCTSAPDAAWSRRSRLVLKELDLHLEYQGMNRLQTTSLFSQIMNHLFFFFCFRRDNFCESCEFSIENFKGGSVFKQFYTQNTTNLQERFINLSKVFTTIKLVVNGFFKKKYWSPNGTWTAICWPACQCTGCIRWAYFQDVSKDFIGID